MSPGTKNSPRSDIIAIIAEADLRVTPASVGVNIRSMDAAERICHGGDFLLRGSFDVLTSYFSKDGEAGTPDRLERILPGWPPMLRNPLF